MKNQEHFMETILEHFENPRNYGPLESPDVIQEGGNPGCGDIIKVYLNVNSEGIANVISFSGEGCMLSQAGASLVLEKLKGKSIKEIQEMPPDIVRDTLGKKLVSTRPRCAMLGFNTLKNAVKQWQRQQTLSEIKNS